MREKRDTDDDREPTANAEVIGDLDLDLDLPDDDADNVRGGRRGGGPGPAIPTALSTQCLTI